MTVEGGGLALLAALGDYIPHMLEEEIIYVIFAARIPSPDCVTRWEMARSAREAERGRIMSAAMDFQRSRLAGNSRDTGNGSPGAAGK